MPEPSTLKINEIFWSFQGEGLRVGVPAIFLRLAGCSLHCPYCDTQDSWNSDAGSLMSLEEILSQITALSVRYPQSQVVITGGEPLEQNLAPVTAALKKKDYFLTIETNGLHFQDLPLDWWTVAPKDVSDYFIHENLVNKINEVKLVVNKNLTLEAVERIRARVPGIPVFFQPDGSAEDGYRAAFHLFRRCQEAGIVGIRAGAQLHKVYDVK